MKSNLIIRTIGVLALANLMACQPKNPPNPNAPAKADDSKATLPLSLQPGKITLNGVIAANARASHGTDGPIAISAQAGSNETGLQVPVDESNKPVFNDSVAADVTEALKQPAAVSAIAFGCSPDEINANLGEPSADPKTLKTFDDSTKLVSAKHVLLCGNNPLTAGTSLVISADEITLLNAKLNLKSPAGITIQTRILTVKGQSRVSTGPSADEPSAAGEVAAVLNAKATTGAAQETAQAPAPTATPAAQKELAGGPITVSVVEKVNIDNASLVIATSGASQKKAASK